MQFVCVAMIPHCGVVWVLVFNGSIYVAPLVLKERPLESYCLDIHERDRINCVVLRFRS